MPPTLLPTRLPLSFALTLLLCLAACEKKNQMPPVSGAGADTSGEALHDACTEALGLPCEQVLEGYLKASNSEGYDLFGSSVSLSGDRLAVSARQEDSCADGMGGDQTDDGCNDAGAVYLMRLAP